jgi:transposase
MADRITYVGLDVHKDSIVVAVAVGGLRGEVREYGRIANTPTALDRLLRKLGGDGMTLRFCYEAGPCGYGIQRRLSTQGHECVVVAPSLIPKRAGDRVKTDRRDAASLARLHRAGELTAVWVPDAAHEAMRDLVRARLDAVHSLRRARQQLSGFLLRHGCHYGRPAWTRLHHRWLAGLKFEQAVHHIVLEDYIAAVEAAEARRNRLTAQIEAMLPDWTLAPVVAALQTMRGMALVNAATLIAELGDLSRFANPRQLMAYLGLVPSELEWRQRQTRWHHQGRQCRRPPAFDRGGVELPLPGPAQPRVAVAAREPAQADPGHRLEGATAVVRALSKARPHRQAGQHCHHRDRPRTVGLCLGHRPAGGGDDRLITKEPMIAAKGGASEPPNIGLPDKAGGAVAVRRTLASTICRIPDPTQVSRPRQLRDVSTVMRLRPAHQSMINRRFNDRASCPARKRQK